MTEASPGTLLLDAAHGDPKIGSAGAPHFFTDVRVVRPDMTPRARRETGEIVVAGPNVMPGYWEPARGTPSAAALTGGPGFARGTRALSTPTVTCTSWTGSRT